MLFMRRKARSTKVPMPKDDDQTLLDAALSRDHGAVERLIRHLLPVIQYNVGRALVGDPFGSQARNMREEVEDLCQEVLTTLFKEDARVLRVWDPTRGASLRTFVGTVARRRAGAILGAKRHNPWYLLPVEQEHLEAALRESPEAESALAARQVWTIALAATLDAQSDKGKQIGAYLFRDGLDNADIAQRTGMSPSAVYQWRSRLTRAFKDNVTRLLDEGSGEDSP